MIQNLLDEIKLVRRIKGGTWLKTVHRSWITLEVYEDYLSYAFDCIVVYEEKY